MFKPLILSLTVLVLSSTIIQESSAAENPSAPDSNDNQQTNDDWRKARDKKKSYIHQLRKDKDRSLQKMKSDWGEKHEYLYVERQKTLQKDAAEEGISVEELMIRRMVNKTLTHIQIQKIASDNGLSLDDYEHYLYDYGK